MRIVIFLHNDTPTTHLYTLSLHDALPISSSRSPRGRRSSRPSRRGSSGREAGARRLPLALRRAGGDRADRSEEHTSELQSRLHLVCRLLLEKKKTMHSTLSRHTRRSLVVP